jgi:hypothetical protein
MISAFCCEVAENCTILDIYATGYWQFLTNVLGQPIGPILRVQESEYPTFLLMHTS